MTSTQLTSLFSLCQKAGRLASGEVACEKLLQSQKAALVLVCEDASDNTKKKFCNKSFFYGVPFYIKLEKNELSRAIGKENRAVVAVDDQSFAERLIAILSQ